MLAKEKYYDLNAVSNSSLNWLLPETGGSLKKYKYYSTLAEKPEESESMRLGTLIHLFVEKKTMNVFKVANVPSPSIKAVCDLVMTMKDGATKENITEAVNQLDYQSAWKIETRIQKILSEGLGYMAAIGEAETEGKVLVNQEEYDKISQIAQNLEESLPINFDTRDDYRILNEVPIKFDWPDTDIQCKSLIDIVVINDSRKTIGIYDLKTTTTPGSIYFGYDTSDVEGGKIVTKKVEGLMYKRQVHRQLAFYKQACMSNWPDYEVVFCNVVCAETVAPYEIQITSISDEHLRIGKQSIEKALAMLKTSYATEYDL